jgi:hypothetical protein
MQNHPTVGEDLVTMVGMLATDDPSVVELDCRGDDLRIRERVLGAWHDLMPVPATGSVSRSGVMGTAASLAWQAFLQSDAAKGT